jgi:hypothetical protein
MFLFYHSKQEQSNLNYYKGTLFERLLASYLASLGFTVEIRQKHNSLEYDLAGTAIADGRTLIGEAKAHGRSIAGEIITSFAGKLLIPQISDPHVVGLFLSTSSLTAEAEDYLRRLREVHAGPRIRSLSGDQLLQSIAEQLKLPSSDTTAAVVQSLGAFPLSAHLLATENGPLILHTAASSHGATPSHFCIIRADGAPIADDAFLADVGRRVPELADLAPLAAPSALAKTQPARRDIGEALLLGKDWADYRLPAPPQFFVGRRAIVSKLVELVSADSHDGVVQVKSRSGVGKSSLMAFLLSELQRHDLNAQLYDARNTKTLLDLWSLVQRFTGSATPPSDFNEVERQLDRLAASQSRSVLLIDQFESTFVDPDLYDGYEFLALAIARRRPHLAVIFARKNDLLTTFDEQHISLDRLNSVSKSILLEDFGASEAVELIEQISRNAKRPVSNPVKHYVLEFAQGFPWLLKRTMAHVLRLSQKAEGRASLLSTTLRLDDLFDEELEGLDEIERGYLTRIAQRLPATYQQLERAFDEDPSLPQVIRKLTETRLLRLSGNTYDTYNDVFKEYLVYRRLPEFRVSFIYKLTPANVLVAYGKLIPLRRFTTEQLREELKAARGTAFNLLHELRALELVGRDGKEWVIPDGVIEAYGRSRFGEYVRHQLMQNGVVSDLLAHLQSGQALRIEDLPYYLATQLPFIPASDETWRAYANVLLSWLETVFLVSKVDGRIVASPIERTEAIERVGNLLMRPRGKRPGTAPFCPSSRFPEVIRAAELALNGSFDTGGPEHANAFRDLFDLGLMDQNGRLLSPGIEELRAAIRVKLSAAPYSDIWGALQAGTCTLDLIAEKLVMAGLAEATVKWRAKILGNWGRELGLLPTSLKVRLVNPPPPAVL